MLTPRHQQISLSYTRTITVFLAVSDEPSCAGLMSSYHFKSFKIECKKVF